MGKSLCFPVFRCSLKSRQAIDSWCFLAFLADQSAQTPTGENLKSEVHRENPGIWLFYWLPPMKIRDTMGHQDLPKLDVSKSQK